MTKQEIIDYMYKNHVQGDFKIEEMAEDLARPNLQPTCNNLATDTISRQATIDEIEHELEMINSALDSTTLDFNARERLRQRKGEAREILNSIQQLPSVESERKKGKWIWKGKKPWERCRCSECGYYRQLKIPEPDCFCPNCGSYNGGKQDD